MKATKALNLTYEAATGHDDIVSAIAIECWLGEQAPQPLTDERIKNAVWSATWLNPSGSRELVWRRS